MRKITKGVLFYELLGFCLLMLFTWVDEILDLSHLLWHAPSTPINYIELLQESAVIILLGSFIIYRSISYLRHIHYLEGFIRMCSHCRKVELDGKWISLEELVDNQTESKFTHGICKDCLKKYYSDI